MKREPSQTGRRVQSAMNNTQQGRFKGALVSFVAGFNPMKSFTFLLALGLIALAALSWLKQTSDPQASFPLYGTIAGSYAGGFLAGRLLARLVKIAVVVAALVIGALVLLGRIHVDTSKAKEATEAGSTWVRNEASQAKHYLLHLLPSGSAAGVGAFAGGRRRTLAPAKQ